jgi:hypothetical protein
MQCGIHFATFSEFGVQPVSSLFCETQDTGQHFFSLHVTSLHRLSCFAQNIDSVLILCSARGLYY